MTCEWNVEELTGKRQQAGIGVEGWWPGAPSSSIPKRSTFPFSEQGVWLQQPLGGWRARGPPSPHDLLQHRPADQGVPAARFHQRFSF